MIGRTFGEYDVDESIDKKGRGPFRPETFWVKGRVGLALTLGGGALIYVSYDGSKDSGGMRFDYTWLGLGVIGASFGLHMVLQSLWRMRDAMLFSRLKREHPREPAYADYIWDARCERHSVRTVVVRSVLEFIFLAIPVLAANFFLLDQPDAKIWLYVSIGNLLMVSLLIYETSEIIEALRHGSSELSYETFPYLPGKTMRVTWKKEKPLPTCETIQFTLRYVIESRTKESRGFGQTPAYVQKTKWEEEQEFELESGYEANHEMAVEFELPPDFINRLRWNRPRYYCLEVGIYTHTGWENEEYLIPVYDKA